MVHLTLGLVADTHGVFDPAAAEQHTHACLILHAGDVGSHGGHKDVLQHYANATNTPVIAVAGNVDDALSAADEQLLPSHRLVQIAGWKVLLTHIVASGPQAKVDATAAQLIQQLHPDIVVFGHSHKAACWQADGVYFINPGSAGSARFKLPRTVARLHLPFNTLSVATGKEANTNKHGHDAGPIYVSEPCSGVVYPDADECSARCSTQRTRKPSRPPCKKQRLSQQSSAMPDQQSSCATNASLHALYPSAAAPEGAQQRHEANAQAAAECCGHQVIELGRLQLEIIQLPAKAPPRLAACM